MKQRIKKWIKNNCFPIHESYVLIWTLGVFIGTLLSISTTRDLTWIQFIADGVTFLMVGIPLILMSAYAIRATTEKCFDIKTDQVCFIATDGTQLDWESNEVDTE